MLSHHKQINKNFNDIYNNILSLSRNPIFYTKFNLSDTFQNRIYLIFIHISFIFIKVKESNVNNKDKKFAQELFDLIFNKIELNMREIGYGDTTINKNMKFLIKKFYNILLNCEKYKKMSFDKKNSFFNNLIDFSSKKNLNRSNLINYFIKYEAFCFDLNINSVLKGEIKFTY